MEALAKMLHPEVLTHLLEVIAQTASAPASKTSPKESLLRYHREFRSRQAKAVTAAVACAGSDGAAA